MNENSENALKLINEISKEKKIICDNEIKEISNNSLITNRKKIKQKTKKKLSNILKDL
jgi:hypothetical protein